MDENTAYSGDNPDAPVGDRSENWFLVALNKLVDLITKTDAKRIGDYVEKLRSQNPGIKDDDLAWKIVHRKSLKCGLVGAATGIPGLIALPLTVSADLIACWRIQVVMSVAIARVYGHTEETTDLKTDIYLILAGDAAKEVLKRFGIAVGKDVTWKLVHRIVTREVMKKIGNIASRKIITKGWREIPIQFHENGAVDRGTHRLRVRLACRAGRR